MVTSRKALLVSTPAPMKLIVISVSLRRSRALLAGPALFPSVNSGNCTDVWRGDPAWRPGYRAIVGDLGANGRPRRLSTPNFSDREQIRSRFIGDRRLRKTPLNAGFSFGQPSAAQITPAQPFASPGLHRATHDEESSPHSSSAANRGIRSASGACSR